MRHLMYGDDSSRNSFIASATDFYGHNDLDIVSLFLRSASSYIYTSIFRSLKCQLTVLAGLLINSTLKISRGNGALTFDENKAHFTLWALMKSPLLIVSLFNREIVSLPLANFGSRALT